jgi:hypothetical protein
MVGTAGYRDQDCWMVSFMQAMDVPDYFSCCKLAFNLSEIARARLANKNKTSTVS